MAQQHLGVGPALVLLADAVLDRHSHVVEAHLVDLVVAVDGDDGAQADAGALHVDQQERDSGLLLAPGRGAHQAEDHVGVLGQGGPDLRPVDHVMAAVAHCSRGERGEVGAGVGFGIALAPPVAAAQVAGQVAALLRRRAEGDDDRSHQLGAERIDARREAPHQLVLEDVAADRAPAGAAVLGRPGRRRPALGVENSVPGDDLLLGGAEALLDLAPDGGGQVVADEGADLFSECLVCGTEVEVHGGFLVGAGAGVLYSGRRLRNAVGRGGGTGGGRCLI